MSLERGESVVRALHLPFWDPSLKRGTKSAFQQTDVSVSREAILSHDEIVAIFVSDLNRPATAELPARSVEGTATLNVGEVLDVCNADRNVVSVQFVADPVAGAEGQETNPAHALMQVRDGAGGPRKLPNALAMAVLRLAVMREVPSR